MTPVATVTPEPGGFTPRQRRVIIENLRVLIEGYHAKAQALDAASLVARTMPDAVHLSRMRDLHTARKLELVDALERHIEEALGDA